MLQREIRSIVNHDLFGCATMTVANFVMRRLGRKLTEEEYSQVFGEAIIKGYILHNNLPRDGSAGEWYRCFVVDWVGWANLLLDRFRVPISIASMVRQDKPGPDWCAKCYRTKWGYHFVLADSNGKDIVNPDPTVPVIKVNDYRVFKIK